MSIRKLNGVRHCTVLTQKEKKRKSFYALVGSFNENSIVLHDYIGKMLKSHDSKLVHFTHQGTCIAFNA